MMRRILLLALILLLPPAAGATVLVPIEFRELVRVSSTIVRGRVADVRSAWVDGRQSIETFVTVDAEEYLKGSAGETLIVRVPGGEMGRYRTVFVGAPEFHAGDEVVLFLRSAGSALPYIVGLNQGAFRIVADRTGRRIVSSPVLMGKSLDQPEVVLRGDAARRPLQVDAFRELVQRVIAEGAAR